MAAANKGVRLCGQQDRASKAGASISWLNIAYQLHFASRAVIRI